MIAVFIQHIVVSSTPRLSGIRTRCELVVIGTDYIVSYKYNYHKITTIPQNFISTLDKVHITGIKFIIMESVLLTTHHS